MTKDEVTEVLKGWGVAKPFRLGRDPNDEREVWLVLTRKPVEIVEGWLVGSEIMIDMAEKCFRVWTSRKMLAKKLAALHGLKFKGWDGECDLYITPELADLLLPMFGGKYVRSLSDAQKSVLASGRRNSPIFQKVQG